MLQERSANGAIVLEDLASGAFVEQRADMGSFFQ
jgi:hypothetical protein